MPCWYYEKKELRATPSLQDGIEPSVEARYRREGARFIIDAGTKMGLRYDTCATGVVYFHRFYMFHSFKEFHRYVTGACCLFLSGKVEETPKKCKDIIKMCRGLLTEQQFSVFGEDPREEVMTLERILLQTIKFDLQVEHPYGKLLYYAKLVKGDKQKIQKVVQMAWTFINDSLCTTLSLQWEPDIISVAMLYLATRLSKLDIQDWVGKLPGSKLKWWEGLLEDLSQELVEDICHQVLDLYSQKAKAQNREESPPIANVPRPPGAPPPLTRRNRPGSPTEDRQQNPSQPKSARIERDGSHSRGSSKERTERSSSKGRSDPAQSSNPYSAAPIPSTAPAAHHPPTTYAAPTGHSQTVAAPAGGHQTYQGGDNGYTQFNPYVSSQMYSASFMSQEGSQSIQSLITGGAGSSSQQYQNPSGYSQAPTAQHTQQPEYSQSYQAPGGYQAPASAYQNAPVPGQPYQQQPAPSSYPASGYPAAQGAYPGAPASAPASTYNPPPGQPYPATTAQPPYQQQYSYGQPQAAYSQPPVQGYPYQQPQPVSPAVRGPRPRFGGPPGPPRGPPPQPNSQQQQQQQQQAVELNNSTGLATVRITGRR